MSRGWRRFTANRGALIGGAIVLALVAIALFGPLLVGDPLARDLDHGLAPNGSPLAIGGHALLGTDALGRDVWARVVHGAGSSLAIAGAATLFALVLGVTVGIAAGLGGGWPDTVLMRLVDLVLAFPYLLLAILLGALLRERELASASAPVIVTLGVVGWTTTARVVRVKAMAIARGDYVQAARASGASPWRIATRHVLPNALGAIVVVTALGFAQNLLAESVLGYLGLGPPPPAPTWGQMIYEGRLYYRTAPHLVVVPGLAIVLAVIAFNLVGDGLRDAFDPKERG